MRNVSFWLWQVWQDCFVAFPLAAVSFLHLLLSHSQYNHLYLHQRGCLSPLSFISSSICWVIVICVCSILPTASWLTLVLVLLARICNVCAHGSLLTRFPCGRRFFYQFDSVQFRVIINANAIPLCKWINLPIGRASACNLPMQKRHGNKHKYSDSLCWVLDSVQIGHRNKRKHSQQCSEETIMQQHSLLWFDDALHQFVYYITLFSRDIMYAFYITFSIRLMCEKYSQPQLVTIAIRCL